MNRWSYRISPGDRYTFVLQLDDIDVGFVHWARQLDPSMMLAAERIVRGLNVQHGRANARLWSGRPIVGTHTAELACDGVVAGEIEFPRFLTDKRRWLRLAVGGLNDKRDDGSSIPTPRHHGPAYVPGDFDVNTVELGAAS